VSVQRRRTRLLFRLKNNIHPPLPPCRLAAAGSLILPPTRRSPLAALAGKALGLKYQGGGLEQ
jgi:hypothetical protein